MFDWLGLSPEATMILGCVFIAIGAILLISLGIWIFRGKAVSKVATKKSKSQPKSSIKEKELIEENQNKN